MSTTARGKKGEEQAVAALEAAGMKVIMKNYRARIGNARQLGEVDIIALDGETVVFAEVKAWSVFGQEDLQYGLNAKKQQKIIKTAKYFLLENRKYSNMAIRFDVIFVNKYQVSHLASAFMESV